ncbi:coenzyme A pyrophosphatase [Actinopolyspora erythraea]|uniref:Coenzyme A pyrophosphatase n=1 Tax=Actinopolyspora erythraea TaxID=414996 RepID=A0A099DCJ1_9ACTN|nr:CoA pyrophosphatase [Actinopolyspora erythraea]ASU77167.1 coenzyme A pyrophosphatase [Actinopolyspora erythraea]KGI83140.1 NUDIX hydrolase [Actinopolyspora erythraea]
MSEEHGPLVDPNELPTWLRPLVERSAEVDATSLGWLRPPEGDSRIRPASVLILFGEEPEHHDGPDVLLLRRAESLNSHPGQVAFPGGATDDGDAGPVDTALREAIEEVGVLPSGITPAATLPELYLAHSDFRVTPVLAHWHHPTPVTAVDPAETAAVARVPISMLTEPSNRINVRIGGRTTPAFLVPSMLVWGFTGGLLDGVLDLAGWSRGWNRGDVRELSEAWQAAVDIDDPGFGQ